jgi:hypothetical protein
LLRGDHARLAVSREPLSPTKADNPALRPLSVSDLAVMAQLNIKRSIDYRHPADPARNDPTC